MNVISKIRKSLNEGYDYLVNIDTFNQLQAEWITRAKMEGFIEKQEVIDQLQMMKEAYSNTDAIDELLDFIGKDIL